jgi:hypothetical protein
VISCRNASALNPNFVPNKIGHSTIQGGSIFKSREVSVLAPACLAIRFIRNRSKKLYFEYLSAPAAAMTRVGRQCVFERKALIILSHQPQTGRVDLVR